MCGDTLIAVRFDLDDNEHYKIRFREIPGAWVAASEPVGTDTTGWEVLPAKSMGIFTGAGAPEIVQIFPPPWAYLVIAGTTIDDDTEGDSHGNGDGDCDSGEQIELIASLRNDGYETATHVRATIATADTFCLITDDYEEYDDIAPGEELPCLEDFDLSIDPRCPDGYQVPVSMLIEADSREIWEREFVIDVHAPVLEIDSYRVDDTTYGNGDGRVQPGERFLLTTVLSNRGSEGAADIVASLSIVHPWTTVHHGESTLDSLPVGERGTLSPPFDVEVSSSCPEADVLLGHLTIQADWGRTADLEIMIPVGGFHDDMESGPGGWTAYVVYGGSVNEWHRSQARNYTPGGSWSWKFGDAGDADYQDSACGALESAPVTLHTHSYLRFRHWMEAEVSGSYPGYCYDGGIVEMSVDGGPWEQIFPVEGYPFLIRNSDGSSPFPADTEAFSGSVDWEPVVFEITDYSGDARFRFVFGSDDSQTAEGWYIDEVEFFGSDTLWSETDEAVPLPLRPSMETGRPNPTRSDTRIRFQVPNRSEVILRIFDINGRRVRTLVSGVVPAGTHTVAWDGRDSAGNATAAGLYFCRFETAGTLQTNRLVILR